MMDVREISSIVRGAVETRAVALELGLEVDRNGRCKCPFHHGVDNNMKIYPGTNGYYCFVCHKGGDCISLVTGVVPDCSYVDAMWWINDTFGLGLREEGRRPSVMQRNRRNRYRLNKK